MTATRDKTKCLCLYLFRCCLCLLCTSLVRFRGGGLRFADTAGLGLLEDSGDILNGRCWWGGLGCGLGFRCSLSRGVGFWLCSSSLWLRCGLCFGGLGGGLLGCGDLFRGLGFGLGLLLLWFALESAQLAAASSTNLWRNDLLLGRLGFLLRNLDWARRS